MERKTSQHIVRVFNPNLDPSVAEMLKAEQAKNPKVSNISCHNRLGLISTPKGTFCVDAEGCGPWEPVETAGFSVDFYRELLEDGGKGIEIVPFATAKFSLDELKATLTSEELTLDKFVGQGRRKNENYTEWEKALS